ncbi:photosynthetic reaction center cytochrome c subunit [Dongia mobilis]|uniref:Photosynthetic reaction center cytochrome c subunit n=1 Tax=Dongia mobilis TaxID=578943 RepID=A0A4V3DET0_9PROT|nr:photosynthetic reaction center cytochrome PufC [Dongia mobilis]TDQ82940.1 photosynthetic reaction center cytochrome c subunit [Dongia mobilis]
MSAPLKSTAAIAIIGATVAAAIIFGTFERPPVMTAQNGYRGTGMEQVQNPRTYAELQQANVLPPPLDPVEPGEPSSTVYENVQVLGHVGSDEFIRVMSAITEWVSPEQGCNYCHSEENLALDSVYTKIVARRMLEMTQHINSAWSDHVGQTGVTCLTCHRGNPVPENVWFLDSGFKYAGGFAADLQGQNRPAPIAGLTSLPADPLLPLLKSDMAIRVVSTTALPTGPGASIKKAEETYSLMMHMSDGLGVNCTFCHNAQAFSTWETSTPQRVTAWHGIQMVRDLNANFLEPLTSTFPANRLGKQGDVAKINCSTCHQGVNKPFFGQSMLGDYPVLAAPQ